jgi:flavin-dependent dehydrogenase
MGRELVMHDVIVVGGGPVGLYAAGLCRKMGYETLVIEEDREIGKPLRCSGLISKNIEKFFPAIKKWGVIENAVDSAVLHSRRSSLVLKKPRAAYVINRSLFDKKIAELAGCKIMLNRRVTGIKIKSDCAEISTNRGVITGRMALVCDGPNSLLAGRREAVKGLIAITGNENRAGNVDLYFNKKLLRDGFFWRIPRGKTTEYGVWGSDVKFSDIERFFGIKKYEKFAGMIPIGTTKKTYGERALLIGSSAGQVKPWSGGGVIYGLTCAEIAARTVEKAFRFDDFSTSLLSGYEREWKKALAKHIKIGIVFRKFLMHSNDFQIDVALRAGNILSYSWMDMDFIF